MLTQTEAKALIALIAGFSKAVRDGNEETEKAAFQALVDNLEAVTVAPKPPRMEVNDKGHHRLVSADGKRTSRWFGFSHTSYLDGYVGYTVYWANKAGVTTADEFFRMTHN